MLPRCAGATRLPALARPLCSSHLVPQPTRSQAGLSAVGVGGALVAALELRDAGDGGLATAVVGVAQAAGDVGSGDSPDHLLGLLVAAELVRMAACGGLFIAATRLWFVRRAQVDAAAEVLHRRQRTLRTFSTQAGMRAGA